MSIEYKVIARDNPQDRTQKKYYASANVVGETTTRELCKAIEKMSTVSGVDVQAVLYALAEVIPQYLAAGKSVRIGELGCFRITVRSDGQAHAAEVGAHSRRFAHVTENLHYRKIH